MSFDLSQLDDYSKFLQYESLANTKEYNKVFNNAASQWGRDCSKRMKKDSSFKITGKKNELKWDKYKFKQEGTICEIDVFNKSKMFHLLENGHEKYAHGKHLGFTAGGHFAEKTREEWNNGKLKEIIEKQIEKHFN